ncbi:MAG: hypothetical protein ACRD96_24250 [Bryobacteraceae bacterium]
MIAWADGDRGALDRLIPLVESELRRLARGLMSNERPGHVLLPRRKGAGKTVITHPAPLEESETQYRRRFFGPRIGRPLLEPASGNQFDIVDSAKSPRAYGLPCVVAPRTRRVHHADKTAPPRHLRAAPAAFDRPTRRAEAATARQTNDRHAPH